MIQKHLSQGDMEGVIKQIAYIGEKKDTTQFAFLIELLKSTDNTILRNTIAIALMDIGDDRAVEPLIEVITDPKTSGSRGTLLYALENLNYIVHIESIIPFIGDSSLEVSAQSFMLLEQIMDKLSDLQNLRCQQLIEMQISHNQSKLLEVALDMLKKLRY
ncbi:HEAT repeat domain-containing protein [Paenibacillus sp. JNUCC31]|uniref:HEAT repeat domain-containing protein n=1 Tax=Paenibacillus sp. JNUCC-31 TaxID=2777983 RepID=UPI001E3946C2|nr:HEAT repeat domain-containing protein [Paenibacillus sp. JNUCC-31]